MKKASGWIRAFRLRTLPLAAASIGMGAFLAAGAGAFRWPILVLSLLTTLSLQILSNLANDYGDSIHGADSEGREGPSRAVQSGVISLAAMKRAMFIFGFIAFAFGVCLIWISFGSQWPLLVAFLLLGIFCIWGAITYTAGGYPYGYAGLGDISVMVFFGLIGVVGSYYLHTLSYDPLVILPALSLGFFATAVLNVNNVRDIESDERAGKKSIPVRVGREKAVIYHFFLLFGGISCAIIYGLLRFDNLSQWIFLIVVPILIMNARAVQKIRDPRLLDPKLKQMALATLVFTLSFGIGVLL